MFINWERGDGGFSNRAKGLVEGDVMIVFGPGAASISTIGASNKANKARSALQAKKVLRISEVSNILVRMSRVCVSMRRRLSTGHEKVCD